MNTALHKHEVKHWPASGEGYGVCACGATTSVTRGKPSGSWHACSLCVVGAPPPRRWGAP